MVPNVLVMPPPQAASIVISKGESSVRAYDASGALLAFYAATIGSEHDPLPLGEWKINGVARDPKFHYNPELFWDAKKSADKQTLAPGPNNPVGLAWIDLSKDHYGIHGTPEPGKVGHADLARLHPADQLGRAGTGGDRPARHAGHAEGVGA